MKTRARKTANQYDGMRFYVRKNTGKVLAVSRTPRMNGTLIEGATSPAHNADEQPVTTWIDPTKLISRFVEVSEAKAREIDPLLFRVFDLYERSAAYRKACNGFHGSLQRTDERDTGRGTL